MAEPRRDLVILGAGRQGRNINDVCVTLGRPVLGFLDDTKPAKEKVNGVPVLGGFALARDAELLARAELIVGGRR
jgi:FlaA1/EpsC-like NDP-sugar epimerase